MPAVLCKEEQGLFVLSSTCQVSRYVTAILPAGAYTHIIASLQITPSRIWDGFNMDIAHMSLPPPYTQALFVDLRRFIPGQSDDVALNRATVFVPTAPTLPPAGPSDYHSPTVAPLTLDPCICHPSPVHTRVRTHTHLGIRSILYLNPHKSPP